MEKGKQFIEYGNSKGLPLGFAGKTGRREEKKLFFAVFFPGVEMEVGGTWVEKKCVMNLEKKISSLNAR